VAEHRRPSIPFSDAPRGTCRWCGDGILHEAGEKRGETNGRRRWPPVCVDAYNESDPREARRRVRKRDRGRCAICGLDTVKLRRSLRGKGAVARARALGFKRRGSFWELDHIVPLIDGGGHELSNLQTLCTPCHKRKTSDEAAVRREARVADAERDVIERADEALERSRQLLASLGSGS
jgi:5-methylcytosine-specific restriction endonuclease McrA